MTCKGRPIEPARKDNRAGIRLGKRSGKTKGPLPQQKTHVAQRGHPPGNSKGQNIGQDSFLPVEQRTRNTWGTRTDHPSTD